MHSKLLLSHRIQNIFILNPFLNRIAVPSGTQLYRGVYPELRGFWNSCSYHWSAKLLNFFFKKCKALGLKGLTDFLWSNYPTKWQISLVREQGQRNNRKSRRVED